MLETRLHARGVSILPHIIESDLKKKIPPGPSTFNSLSFITFEFPTNAKDKKYIIEPLLKMFCRMYLQQNLMHIYL